jgi:hypothetical protein
LSRWDAFQAPDTARAQSDASVPDDDDYRRVDRLRFLRDDARPRGVPSAAGRLYASCQHFPSSLGLIAHLCDFQGVSTRMRLVFEKVVAE